jgi:hypothetical protein
MATAKDCHILTSYYKKKFKERYLEAAVVNDHTARWGFDSMLKGLSPEDIKELLDYWFSVVSPVRHRIDWFFYNYEKLIEARQLQQEDSLFREKLRHDSEERAKKWRERANNRGK